MMSPNPKVKWLAFHGPDRAVRRTEQYSYRSTNCDRATRPMVAAAGALLFACSPLAAHAVPSATSGDQIEQQTLDDARPGPNGDKTDNSSSIVIYDANYFAAYGVNSVADMLRWIPGTAALVPRDGNAPSASARGFGSGGDQILINGKRLSGKATDIGSVVQRMKAERVARIEVIRGTAPGLEVQSQGIIVNIVLIEGGSTGSGSWQVHYGDYFENAPGKFDGRMSYSNEIGPLNYLLSAESGPLNRGTNFTRTEDYLSPEDGQLFERRDYEEQALQHDHIYTASGTLHGSDGRILNVNARLANLQTESNRNIAATDVNTAEVEDTHSLLDTDSKSWEIGGDLEQRLGRGALKTRLIYADSASLTSDFTTLTSTSAEATDTQTLVVTDQETTETILRSSFRSALNKGRNLELGAEVAKNTLQKAVSLFEQDATDTLVPVDIFNSDSNVEEIRYEAFGKHYWPLSSVIALESAINVEYSNISQIGADVDDDRTFVFVKPRFDLRWDISEQSQLRSSLARSTSQLNFNNFVATFDREDVEIDAGNPDLEPQKAWVIQMTYERRLTDDRGMMAARAFYNDYDDHIDKVAISETASAPGNIGDARLYGIEFKSSLRLDQIGLDTAVLDAIYKIQNSETIDPFTGEERPMANVGRQQWSLRWRHDIPDWRFNYALDLDWNTDTYTQDINFRQQESLRKPRAFVTGQLHLMDNLVLWLQGRVIFGDPRRRIREIYTGNIADGILLQQESRLQEYRPETIVGLRGRF
ncbi:TonB-dependent receptor plug domain-containing protein [Woeseia oceani]|nr:TonB-dependent receptor [Woeseia oceani]